MLDYAPRWIVTNKPLKEMLWHLHYPPLRRAVRRRLHDSIGSFTPPAPNAT